MKTSVALATILILGSVAVDVLAAGRGNGGNRQGSNTATGTASTVRPADSQRRDGTFLTTGTTANGSTTRKGNGTGLQDGTSVPAVPVVVIQ